MKEIRVNGTWKVPVASSLEHALSDSLDFICRWHTEPLVAWRANTPEVELSAAGYVHAFRNHVFSSQASFSGGEHVGDASSQPLRYVFRNKYPVSLFVLTVKKIVSEQLSKHSEDEFSR